MNHPDPYKSMPVLTPAVRKRFEALLASGEKFDNLRETVQAIRERLSDATDVRGEFGSDSGVPPKELHDILAFRLSSWIERFSRPAPLGHEATVENLGNAACDISIAGMNSSDPKVDKQGWDTALYFDAKSDQLIGAILFRPRDYTDQSE